MIEERPTRFIGYVATADGKIISLKGRNRREMKPGASSPYGHKIVCVCVDGKASSHSMHRMIWEAFYGPIPDGMEIDHIDRNPSNNAVHNLRLATREQNARNNSGHRNSGSKHSGVSFYKRQNKWTATIRVKRKLVHLGYFDTEQQAAEKRLQAEKVFFGEFAPQWT